MYVGVTMGTALTHLSYDLRTLQAETVNERGKHLEHKYDLGLALDYWLQITTDTPVEVNTETVVDRYVACVQTYRRTDICTQKGEVGSQNWAQHVLWRQESG